MKKVEGSLRPAANILVPEIPGGAVLWPSGF